jgi:Glyoxalase/Bleomycin resistance protein/Dioxygenase superfamily
MALLPARAIDHVGIAAPGPGAELARLLGGDPAAAGRAMPSGVTVGRFGPAGGLELIWPGRPGTPVDGFLARRGPGLHHVALRVEVGLPRLRDELLAAGVELVGDVDVSSDGRPCLFLHPRSTGGVLVELVEGERRDG